MGSPPLLWSKSRQDGSQPGTLKYYVRVGDAAREARNWPAAEAAYRSALDQGARVDAFNVQLGHALKEQGRLDEAQQCYRNALEVDDKNADTHLQLGHVLKLAGRKAEAIAAYKRACELDPSDPEAALEYQSLTGVVVSQSGGKITPAEMNEAHGLISALRRSNAETYGIFQSLPLISK